MNEWIIIMIIGLALLIFIIYGIIKVHEAENSHLSSKEKSK